MRSNLAPRTRRQVADQNALHFVRVVELNAKPTVFFLEALIGLPLRTNLLLSIVQNGACLLHGVVAARELLLQLRRATTPWSKEHHMPAYILNLIEELTNEFCLVLNLLVEHRDQGGPAARIGRHCVCTDQPCVWRQSGPRGRCSCSHDSTAQWSEPGWREKFESKAVQMHIFKSSRNTSCEKRNSWQNRSTARRHYHVRTRSRDDRTTFPSKFSSLHSVAFQWQWVARRLMRLQAFYWFRRASCFGGELLIRCSRHLQYWWFDSIFIEHIPLWSDCSNGKRKRTGTVSSAMSKHKNNWTVEVGNRYHGQCMFGC